MAVGETWIHHYTTESNQQSMQLIEAGSSSYRGEYGAIGENDMTGISL